MKRLFPASLLVVLAIGPALAITPADLRVDTFFGEAFTGDVLEATERLPEDVHAFLPERDGDAFILELPSGAYPARSVQEVQATLARLLPAVGFTGNAERLVYDGETPFLSVDADLVATNRVADLEAMERRLTDRLGDLSPSVRRALSSLADTAEARLSGSRQTLSFRQTVEGWNVERMGVSVVVDDAGSIVRISGALTNIARLDSQPIVSAADARLVAERHLAEETGVASTENADAAAEAVPYGRGLLPAWRVLADTDDGPVWVYVDAAAGDVVGVLSLRFPIEGRTFTPSPDGLEEVVDFDAYPLGVSTLYGLGGPLWFLDQEAADGCTDALATGSFDIAPYNDTTNVDSVIDPGYNCYFQQVNAYGRLWRAHEAFIAHGAGGTDIYGVVVDFDGWLGNSADQAYYAWNGNINPMLYFGVGSRTLDSTANVADDNYWNFALDESVLIHELGHAFTLGNPSSVLHPAVGEGLSDFFAMAILSQDTVAGWSAQDVPPVQDGTLPRQADPADVFPDHMFMPGGENEVHANGQILAWALWSLRQELLDRTPLGATIGLEMVVDLAGTLPAHDPALADEPSETHKHFVSVLNRLVMAAGATDERLDVLQAFARAGLFTSPREVVVDIDEDVLDGGGAPPTFTVWTGRDYTFSGTQIDPNATGPYFRYYQVEVSDNAAFDPAGIVVLEPLQLMGPANTAGTTHGSYTLSQATWNQLKTGDALYYRAIARTALAPSGPDWVWGWSTATNDSDLPVPAGKALIN